MIKKLRGSKQDKTIDGNDKKWCPWNERESEGEGRGK